MTSPLTFGVAVPNARIGSNELAYAITFMAKDDETTRFDARIQDTILSIAITFSAPEEKEQAGAWSIEDGVLNMRFRGWSNPLGSALIDPSRLGDVRGEPVSFDMAHQRIGLKNLVHFFIFVGPKNGQL